MVFDITPHQVFNQISRLLNENPDIEFGVVCRKIGLGASATQKRLREIGTTFRDMKRQNSEKLRRQPTGARTVKVKPQGCRYFVAQSMDYCGKGNRQYCPEHDRKVNYPNFTEREYKTLVLDKLLGATQ
jgi:hypothetical protein